MRLKVMLAVVVMAAVSHSGTAEPTSGAQMQSPLLPYVKINKVWGDDDFNEFIEHLSIEQRQELKKALGIDCKKDYGNSELTIIKKRIIWEYSSVFTYPFKSNEVNYDEIVQWVAGKTGVSAKDLAMKSSFVLEQLICEKIFKEYIDALPAEKRDEILKQYTSNDRLLTKAGYPASVASVLLGPGLGITGCVLAGRADYKDTLAAIIQIHKFKLQALKDSNVKTPAVTNSFDLAQKKYFSTDTVEKEAGIKALQELASQGHQSAIYILKINNINEK